MILAWAALAGAAGIDPSALAGPSFSAGEPVAVTGGWLDPAVTELIEEALTGNHDLAAARAAADLSREAANGARAALLPSASLDGAWSTSSTGSLAAQGLPTTGLPDSYRSASVSAQASWALDLFGASRLSWRASRWEARASEGDLRAVELGLASAVAGAWYQLCAAREQRAIAARQVADAEELLEVVALRYERGEATALELLQQRQDAAATRTALPDAELAVRAAETSLAALLGRDPARSVASEGGLPDLAGEPAVGTPEELLERRPDLLAAAAELEAAEARHAAATRAFAPSLAANASAGRSARYLEDWDDYDTWTVGASASLPIFSGGANVAGLRAAGAGRDAAEHALASAFLAAAQEVELALAAESRARATAEAAGEQLAAARLAHDEARRQYAEGLAGYLTVASTQRAFRAAELGELSARRAVLDARIELLDALGAGLVE